MEMSDLEYISTVEKRRRSDGYLREMYMAIKSNRAEDAAGLLLKAVEADPDNFYSNFEMAKAQISAKNPDKAAFFLERCLAAHPKSPMVLQMLSDIYRSLGTDRYGLLRKQLEMVCNAAPFRSYAHEDSRPTEIINKIADAQDLDTIARAVIVKDMKELKSVLDGTRLPYSSHLSDSWLRMWEYSGAILSTKVHSRMAVLDAGGTGTLFSYYLAKHGCQVTTIDINGKKVTDAQEISARLGFSMTHIHGSISEPFLPDQYFDCIFSICVLEHLLLDDQKKAIKNLADHLRPGGLLFLTFDIGLNAADYPIVTEDQIAKRFVEPSGLELVGNRQYCFDYADLKDKIPSYIFGSLMLWKSGDAIRLPLRKAARRPAPA